MSKDRTIIIEHNCILHEDRRILFDALYTNEFYEYLNSAASDFNFGTVIDNVMFCYFLRPMLTFVFYFKTNRIEYIQIKKCGKFDRQIIISAAFYLGIPCNIKRIKMSSTRHFYNRTIISLTALYLFLTASSEKYLPGKNNRGYDVWIIRDDAIRQKIYDRDKTVVLEENGIGRGSLYQNIIRKYRWKNVIKSYGRAHREYSLIKSVLAENRLNGLSILILPYFAKRLTHIFYWGYSLETLIENGIVGNSVISGNFCDAYAEVEKRISGKHAKTLIVLPHGLEDGFVFPNGYTGDVFYAVTECSCNYLNRLYHTDKFVYDGAVISNMLQKKAVGQAKRYVFFTDGTGNKLDIDLVIHLSKLLKQYEQKLYIKLHPHEKNIKYRDIPNTDYICKIEDALCGNVCISRGSTVLVEAVYNSSVSIQVIAGDNNLACTNIIPSLEDERIAHVSNYKELDALILAELRKERLRE